MKNWKEVTEEEFLKNAPSLYHRHEDTTATKETMGGNFPLVLMAFDRHDGFGRHVNSREYGRITYGEKKKWFIVMTQEDLQAHNNGVMKAIFKDKDPGEVQQQAEREDWENEPNKGLSHEQAKTHLKDAAENRTMGIGMKEILRKQQGK